MPRFLKYISIAVAFALPLAILVTSNVIGQEWIYGLIPGLLVWLLLEVLEARAEIEKSMLASKALSFNNVRTNLEAAMNALSEVGRLRSKFATSAVEDLTKAYCSELQLLAKGMVRVTNPTELTTIPINLAQEMQTTLDATLLWHEDTLKGNLGDEYVAAYSRAIAVRRVRMRRIFVFEDVMDIPKAAKQRIADDMAAGVFCRVLAVEHWKGSNVGTINRPEDFGIWDSKTVWSFAPKKDGKRIAWLKLGAEHARLYDKVFEANWLVADTPDFTP